MPTIPKPLGEDEVRSLLQDVRDFICRYVVLTDHQADAISLWVLHTHAFAAAETTPYLQITSAEKESGKTRLLEVLEWIVANPWLTGRTTASVLARRVDAETPTLLLDEADAAFGGDRSYVQELRGILNSGFRRGGRHTINVPSPQGTWVPRDFSVFCPKAIAGIGSVPDTVASRSVTIRLQRKRPEERVEKLRRRRVRPLAEELRSRLEQILPEQVEQLVKLAESEPQMPPELSDRAEDVWEPLFAIADLAGGDWPERAREASVTLFAEGREDETSHRVQLLADIRAIFEGREPDEISSAELCLELNAIETSPWRAWGHGNGLTPHSLARQLKDFGIVPRHTRDASLRGYLLQQFEDAFGRYLPPRASVKASVAANENHNRRQSKCQDAGGADGSGTAEPVQRAESDGLTPRQPNAEAAHSSQPTSAADAFVSYDEEYVEALAKRLRAKSDPGRDR